MNDEVKKTTDENYENLKALTTALSNDYEKFKQKKVKAAGQRVRASLLNTKKLCDILRKQVKDEITSIPIKHRKASDEEQTTSDEEEKKEDTPLLKPKRKRKANKEKPKEN